MNTAHSVFWPEVVRGVPNKGVDGSVRYGSFSVSLLCLGCMWCFVSLFLVVSTGAIDCLERLVSKMTCYVSSGTLNPTLTLLVTILWHIDTSVSYCGTQMKNLNCLKVNVFIQILSRLTRCFCR